jgi:GST-like protein
MDKQLSQHTYIAGDDYSIADIACYPWVAGIDAVLKPALGTSLAAKPHLRRWMNLLAARPAVQRGMALPKV